MKTIHKYPFKISDHVRVVMPVNAKVLDVQVQGETPCIWAMVYSGNGTTYHDFQLRGTGHDCKGLDAENYVATFQMPNGLVFHLFKENG